MKKLLLAAGVLALIAASCNKQTNNPTPTPTPTPNPTQSNQTYTNATYGFKFEYPTGLNFVTPTYANLQDKITQVQIPATDYPGTNFGDAAVAVSAQYAKDLPACLKLTPPENGDGFKTKVNINGVDWYMTKSSGAAAGNRYDSTIYRTVKSNGGACMEINETIHTSVIENYPAGTVTAVNSADVQARLDAIAKSFTFTN